MNNKCYYNKDRGRVITFTKISEDVLYLDYYRCNLKIDESGNNLVDGSGWLIPIPKNENDQIFYDGYIF